MSKVKAGVEHVIKIGSKADQMGIEAGFKLSYFNDQTKEMTSVDAAAFEFEATVDPVTTVVVGAVDAGSREIELQAIAGITKGSSVKIAGNYHRVVKVDGNVATVKKPLVSALTDGEAVELSGRTGTYGIPVTFPAVGNYTLHVTNFEAGMDNEPCPIVVSEAGVDDLKALIEGVDAKVDSVKSQVDTLDEEEVNGISEQVTAMAETLGAVKDLIKDADGDTVNSVYEFVENINNMLEGSAGVQNLLKINKNLEHMLNGSAKLEDDVDNPTAGKGLVAIFDEIEAGNADVEAIKGLAENAQHGFAAIKQSVVDARASIEAKIEALMDEDNANSLISKINTIKSVVDANGGKLDALNTALLDPATGAVKGINDKLDVLNTALGEVKTELSDKIAEVKALVTDRFIETSTLITNGFSNMSDEFAAVKQQLAGMEEKTSYTVFA